MSVRFQLIAHTGSDPLALSHTPFSNSHRQPLCRSMCYIPMALEAGNKIEKKSEVRLCIPDKEKCTKLHNQSACELSCVLS
jgi:hypothetical protein